MKSEEYYKKLGTKMCKFVETHMDTVLEKCGDIFDSACDVCPFSSLCRAGHTGTIVWLKENDVSDE